MKETIYYQPPTSLEIRATSKGKTIAGYAAVFYQRGNPETEFQLSPTLRERILPGAFDRLPDDVVALYNHNMDAPIGRTSAGTLRLNVDRTGLAYEVDLPDTQAGNDLAASVTRGDIRGSSFGFTVPEDGATLRRDGKTTVRELTAIDLIEVSPVVFPAYDGSSVGMRAGNGEEVLNAILAWRKRQARLLEL